jgi:preprotein translocase subunit SecA
MFEKRIMLDIVDSLWKEHLAAMDYLRQGIHLRAYAQKQPKQEYKREAFELFEDLLNNVKLEVIRFLSRVQFQASEDVEEMDRKRREAAAKSKLNFQKDNSGSMGGPVSEPEKSDSGGSQTPFVRRDRKVGRNEPCPCGSGKKYKTCHGNLA